MDGARVMFDRGIQGSNSVEGFNVTVGDAVAAVDGEPPADMNPEEETWAAITGYRDAMTDVLKLSDERPGCWGTHRGPLRAWFAEWVEKRAGTALAPHRSGA
jgi:hypothetical protein